MIGVTNLMDRAFKNPGWLGISARVTFCILIIIAVHWLRDFILWLYNDIFRTHTVITIEQHQHAIFTFSFLGLFWLSLELVYAIILLVRKKPPKR